MTKRIIGYFLFVIFGANLLFSIFFTFGESITSHIPAIVISIIMLYVAYRLVRSKAKNGQIRNI